VRIFKNLIEAYYELERELKHNGTVYQTQTVQDKHVENNKEFLTKELLGYTFLVRDPDIEGFVDNLKLDHEWINQEFKERIGLMKVNPGEAYKLREVWDEFLHDGRFAYTYSERIGNQVEDVITLLNEQRYSRHGIINIYDPTIDNKRRVGNIRVPCSMYYNVMIRPDGGEDKVHMIYNIRSNDFSAHFPYDLVLARLLQEYIASNLNLKPGDFIYQSNSFHCFYKDSKEIF
jgi:thymidylate synthase